MCFLQPVECGHSFLCDPMAANWGRIIPSFDLLAVLLTQPGMCWPSLLPGLAAGWSSACCWLTAPALFPQQSCSPAWPAQPLWMQEVAHPRVRISLVTFWHSVWHFCWLIPPASLSGWQPCLPPLGCHPWASWWSGWSLPLCPSVYACVCVWLEA